MDIISIDQCESIELGTSCEQTLEEFAIWNHSLTHLLFQQIKKNYARQSP